MTSLTQSIKGGKITQLIIEGAFTPEVIVVKELKPTIRNQGGFGSTDMTKELCKIYKVTLGHAASTKILSKKERYEELRKIIPKEYWDYLDVFDVELAMASCPEHRKGYDFEIHFQENAKLPTPNQPYISNFHFCLKPLKNRAFSGALQRKYKSPKCSRVTIKLQSASEI